MREKLAALRNAIPQASEQREIFCPDEVHGYGDYRRFGRDSWKQIGPCLYSDGLYVLVWSALDPEHGLLVSGRRAQAVRDAQLIVNEQ